MRKMLTLLVLLSVLMSLTSTLLTVGDTHYDHSALVDVDTITDLEFASMGGPSFHPVEMPPRVGETTFVILSVPAGSSLPFVHPTPGAALRKALSSYIL